MSYRRVIGYPLSVISSCAGTLWNDNSSTRHLAVVKSPLLFVVLACFNTGLFAARPEPEAQMKAFFVTLGDKGGSAAVDGLCKGTLLEAQKGAQIAAVSPQLDAALKVYGKVARVENIDKKSFGESFVRYRTISYHTSGAPLFWEFLFFRLKDEWQVYIFQFNDQFDRVFSNSE
jgi:hypothetical protein